MKKTLKNKKILITAGPVWVPVDRVRVITNIFGGALGYLIAELAYKMGAKVTLLMGPGRNIFLKKRKDFKIIRFKYYKEIYKLLIDEVKTRKYDVLIHSAAVSDYAPLRPKSNKIKSGEKNLIIKLVPTIKIVDLIKKIDPNIVLVKFKLEVNNSKKQLINKAYKSLQKSKADIIVANDFKTVFKKHIAYIISKNKKVKRFVSKKAIAFNLLKIVSSRI